MEASKSCMVEAVPVVVCVRDVCSPMLDPFTTPVLWKPWYMRTCITHTKQADRAAEAEGGRHGIRDKEGG